VNSELPHVEIFGQITVHMSTQPVDGKPYFTCYLYGRESWSLTLYKERKLRVSDHRMLKRIFGPKKEEVTGHTKIHNEEL
jgi:hypothetical protein